VTDKIKEYFEKFKARVAELMARFRRQAKKPDLETLAGVSLGASWGRVFGFTYVGFVSMVLGFWMTGVVLLAYASFEVWQAIHLTKHFEEALNFEMLRLETVRLFEAQQSSSSSSSLTVVPS
jgi:hypothetical protein